MYTNISNIIATVIRILEKNKPKIDAVIQVYEPKQLLVLQGMRNTLPRDAYPCLEIEPSDASNEWATTRAQRPRYQCNMTLTASNSNEDMGVEYITTLATAIIEILTDPQNLQMRIINEVRWDSNGGMCDTYLLDSLIESVTYNSSKSGTLRTCEFSWFGLIHEPFPDSHFWIFHTNFDEPVETRPMEIVVPK